MPPCSRIVVFDLETGGIDERRHPVIQLAARAVELPGWTPVDGGLECKVAFVPASCDPEALKVNGYTPERWAAAVTPREALDQLERYFRKHALLRCVSKSGNPYEVARLAGHNAARFDLPFLRAWATRCGKSWLSCDLRPLDTLQLALWALHDADPGPPDFKLGTLVEWLGIEVAATHDALEDVNATIALARLLSAGVRVRKAPRWQCSGCNYVTSEPVGDCKGYCFDPSGKSCDAVPCPNCGALHYWTGSVNPSLPVKPPPAQVRS